MTKKIQLYFLIALIAHLLLFFSVFTLFSHSNPQTIIEQALPAYIYKEEKNNPREPNLPTPVAKNIPVSENGIQKPLPPRPEMLTQTEELSIGKGEQNINIKLKA